MGFGFAGYPPVRHSQAQTASAPYSPFTAKQAELGKQLVATSLEASAGIEWKGGGRSEVYVWTERVQVAQAFGRQGKRERGVMRA